MKTFRKTLNDIRDSWTETDSYLASCEMRARSTPRQIRWQHLRHVNNQAHFVTMIASFEDYVNRALDKCISKQTETGKSWTRRRSWEVLKSESKRSLSFMSKVAVLTEKGRTNYNKIHDYYSDRSEIAHGQFTKVPLLSIPTVYADLLNVAQGLTI